MPAPLFDRAPRVTLFAAFTLLAIVHTWPLALAPGTYCRLDSADANLNTWAIAWVAHTLPGHPGQLFDAPMFHPARLTFAFSEPLIVQGLLAKPILSLGGSPVLAYNLVLLAGFVLTGFAAGLLVLGVTGELWAALVAGALAAFNAHMLTRLPHLQALHLEFLPLAIVALDRVAVRGRTGDALLLAVAVTCQALTSIYALVFTAWSLAWAAAARGLRDTSTWRFVGLIALAAGVCGVLLSPVLYPYYRLAHESGLVRTVGESRLFSSTWTDYLYTGARVHHGLWSQRFAASADANFPGVVATLLALIALTRFRQDRYVRMAASIAAGSVLLSMTPRLPGFEWAHSHLPGLSAIRGYSRAGQFALMAVALLAGFGVARLREWWMPRRGWPLVGAAVLLLVTLEALRAPLFYVSFPGVPAIYGTLAAAGTGVVELPMPGPGQEFKNAPYLVNATSHWLPLVNGYSGFTPRGFMDIYRGMRRFPDDWSVAWLRKNHVNRVVVHTSEFEQLKGTPQLQKIETWPDLELLATEGDIRVYGVRPAP